MIMYFNTDSNSKSHAQLGLEWAEKHLSLSLELSQILNQLKCLTLVP